DPHPHRRPGRLGGKGQGRMSIRIHPTALVEPGVAIGAGTSIWDNVHIRHSTSLGEECIVGEKTYIAYGGATFRAAAPDRLPRRRGRARAGLLPGHVAAGRAEGRAGRRIAAPPECLLPPGPPGGTRPRAGKEPDLAHPRPRPPR